MSETAETTKSNSQIVEANTMASEKNPSKGEKDAKTSDAFNAILHNAMEVEEGKTEDKKPAGTSPFSKSKIVYLVVGIVSLLVVIIVIAMVLKKTEPKGDGESQLWRLTNDSKLENGYSVEWEFEENMWTLPTEETEGYITDSSGQVLSTDGQEVILQDKKDPTDNHQIWSRGLANSEEGWFTLKSNASGKYLTRNVECKCSTIVEDFKKISGFGLGVTDDGINNGGPSALDSGPGGVKGCKGKALASPKFRRGDIEKKDEDGYIETFRIRANSRENKFITDHINIQGTCCWEIYGKNGKKQELPKGFSGMPDIAYIQKFKTKGC